MLDTVARYIGFAVVLSIPACIGTILIYHALHAVRTIFLGIPCIVMSRRCWPDYMPEHKYIPLMIYNNWRYSNWIDDIREFYSYVSGEQARRRDAINNHHNK